MKRHTCVICKKKRYEDRMKKVFISSWVCLNTCENNEDIKTGKKIKELISQLKKINIKHLTGR